jgi:hypothetical protein
MVQLNHCTKEQCPSGSHGAAFWRGNIRGQKVKRIFEQAQAKVLQEKVVELAVRTVRNTTDVQQKNRHR